MVTDEEIFAMEDDELDVYLESIRSDPEQYNKAIAEGLHVMARFIADHGLSEIFMDTLSGHETASLTVALDTLEKPQS